MSRECISHSRATMTKDFSNKVLIVELVWNEDIKERLNERQINIMNLFSRTAMR